MVLIFLSGGIVQQFVILYRYNNKTVTISTTTQEVIIWMVILSVLLVAGTMFILVKGDRHYEQTFEFENKTEQ
jgi:hypothetical protein